MFHVPNTPTAASLLAPSREWVIDRRCNELVGKMLSNTITPQEREEYDQLSAERVDRMTMRPPKWLIDYRNRRRGRGMGVRRRNTLV